jgi:hypothetical protein
VFLKEKTETKVQLAKRDISINDEILYSLSLNSH